MMPSIQNLVSRDYLEKAVRDFTVQARITLSDRKVQKIAIITILALGAVSAAAPSFVLATASFVLTSMLKTIGLVIAATAYLLNVVLGAIFCLAGGALFGAGAVLGAGALVGGVVGGGIYFGGRTVLSLLSFRPQPNPEPVRRSYSHFPMQAIDYIRNLFSAKRTG